MYAAAGLDLRSVYGSYNGNPCSRESPRIILHATKNG